MRGRKPTPSKLKKLRGNPGKRQLPKHEPQPEIDGGLSEPPRWLDKGAKEIWRTTAAELLRLRILTKVDRAALEGYCKAYSRWLECEKVLDRDGLTSESGQGYVQQRPEVSIAAKYLQKVREFAAEFGLTPAARARIQAPEQPPEDDFQKFRQERSAPPATAAGHQAVGNA